MIKKMKARGERRKGGFLFHLLLLYVWVAELTCRANGSYKQGRNKSGGLWLLNYSYDLVFLLLLFLLLSKFAFLSQTNVRPHKCEVSPSVPQRRYWLGLFIATSILAQTPSTPRSSTPLQET